MRPRIALTRPSARVHRCAKRASKHAPVLRTRARSTPSAMTRPPGRGVARRVEPAGSRARPRSTRSTARAASTAPNRSHTAHATSCSRIGSHASSSPRTANGSTSSKPNSRIPASRAHPTTPDGPPLVPRLTAARACGENRAVRALDLMRRYIELARALSHGNHVEVEMIDMLASEERVALIVRERFDRPEGPVEIRRANVYRIEDDHIAEVWIFEHDQYEVDALMGELPL